MADFNHLGDQEIYQGHVWRVAVGRFRSPDSIEFTRDIVRSPGAVAVVPLLFDAQQQASVVLVRQYRPALDCELIEIPAGMRDVADEPPEVTAQRELTEEAGLRAGSLTLVSHMHPAPGMSDTSTMIYLATGCESVEQNLQGPEEDHLVVLHVPLSEAIEMVADGRITDAKTVIGLLVVERSLARG